MALKTLKLNNEKEDENQYDYDQISSLNLNEQIVTDVTRILSYEKELPPEVLRNTWDQKLRYVKEMLDERKEPELLKKIEDVKKKYDDEQTRKSSILKDMYIASVARILKHRIEDKAHARVEDAVLPDVQKILKYNLDCLKSNLGTTGATKSLIGYEALEICSDTNGSTEKLKEVIESYLGKKVSIDIFKQPDNQCISRKIRYGRNKDRTPRYIYVASQMMPIVTVEVLTD